MNKKLILSEYVTIGAVGLFSVFQLHFTFGASLLAFFIGIIFTVFLAFFTLHTLNGLYKKEILTVIIKLYQYVPFILLIAFIFRHVGGKSLAYALDLIIVLLWVCATVSAQFVLYYLNPKRVLQKNPILKEKWGSVEKKKRRGIVKGVFELFDWIDAFIQAIFTVALINIFIFQLYEIPSESMVPEFLIKDRVIGLKTLSGPRFPLSEVGLPPLKTYKRGDILIFSNPHYKNDKNNKFQTFISQLVYMLTFTTVNLNVDDNGQLKADPLVKRVTGVGGEQLFMQDGILYSRTKKSDHFEVVSDDALWAEWNVAGLPSDLRKKVQRIPIPSQNYEKMLKIEKNRQNFDLAFAQKESLRLIEKFKTIKQKLNGGATTDSYSQLLSKNTENLYVIYFFNNINTLVRKLYTQDEMGLWFENFVQSWHEFKDIDFFVQGDLYEKAMFVQNVQLKLAFAQFAVRIGELLTSQIDDNQFSDDAELQKIIANINDLLFYIVSINDMRNMPLFPANNNSGEAQYIPHKHYFMMGDNRFNSLDMRHSYTDTERALTRFDKQSFTYMSNIEQQYIGSEDVTGSPILRFLPTDRFGIPGHTAKK